MGQRVLHLCARRKRVREGERGHNRSAAHALVGFPRAAACGWRPCCACETWPSPAARAGVRALCEDGRRSAPHRRLTLVVLNVCASGSDGRKDGMWGCVLECEERNTGVANSRPCRTGSVGKSVRAASACESVGGGAHHKQATHPVLPAVCRPSQACCTAHALRPPPLHCVAPTHVAVPTTTSVTRAFPHTTCISHMLSPHSLVTHHFPQGLHHIVQTDLCAPRRFGALPCGVPQRLNVCPHTHTGASRTTTLGAWASAYSALRRPRPHSPPCSRIVAPVAGSRDGPRPREPPRSRTPPTSSSRESRVAARRPFWT